MNKTHLTIHERVVRAKYLYEAKQAHEAIALMRECILLEPKNESHRIQLALYLRAIGNFDESLFYVDKVSPSMPGYALLKGWHLIRQGFWNQGMQMREPEIGVYRTDSLYPFPPEKKYTKGTSLIGKKVLLVLEGGNGDEIAYIRFAQTLSKLGAEVATATSAPFVALASRSLSVSKAYAQDAVDHTWYDYYIPAMSMFSLFDIQNPSEGIMFPYITVDKETASRWDPIINDASGGKTKIGIQWQGNPAFDHVEFKTLPAKLLASFAQFGKLFLIQRKETVTPDNVFPLNVDVCDTQTEAPNWEQTLAVINGMDWVVAGDTTITHMAGALGKQAIVLLPHAPHPYWADLKEVSTWYPSIHVVRQPSYDEWGEAVSIAHTIIKPLDTSDSYTVDELVANGQKHYEAKEYKEALFYIQKLNARGVLSDALKVFEAECLHYTGKSQEAIPIMRKLLAQESKNSTYAILLSQYLRAIGNFEESYKLLEQVDPNTPGYYTFLGWHHLRLGLFSEAYATLHKEINTTDITGRLNLPSNKLLSLHAPLQNKKVFLVLDGGFGDQILSIRFAQLLEDRGARVIVGADVSLHSLFKRMNPLQDIRGIAEVNEHEYDYYVSAISCIEILHIENPQEGVEFPYLTAHPQEIEKLKPKIDATANGKLKIGIHWQGNLFFNALDMKSIPALCMLTLSECGTLYSLQRDAGGNTLPNDAKVINLMTDEASWEYTAAAIACLDIIVTNDASVAHLAGALGKKTIVVSPLVASIYWLPYQEKSVWYPNLTLIYQKEYGLWDATIEETMKQIRNPQQTN